MYHVQSNIDEHGRNGLSDAELVFLKCFTYAQIIFHVQHCVICPQRSTSESTEHSRVLPDTDAFSSMSLIPPYSTPLRTTL